MGLVHRRVAVSVFNDLLLVSAAGAFRVNSRVKLIGVSLKARQPTDHENVLVYISFVLQWQSGGSDSVRRIRALAAAKETFIAHAFASSLPANPWWPGIQSRVVFSARLLQCQRSRSGSLCDEGGEYSASGSHFFFEML